jgi:hypothetical protein
MTSQSLLLSRFLSFEVNYKEMLLVLGKSMKTTDTKDDTGEKDAKD